MPYALLAVLVIIYLLVWFEKSKHPKPKFQGKPAQPPETTKWKIAVHEAGHALVALRCTAVDSVLSIRSGNDDGEVRHVFGTLDETGRDWCQLVIAMAGIAAETMVFRKFRSGRGETDLIKAIRFARNILRTSTGTPRPSWRVPEGIKSPPFGAVFQEPPGKDIEAILAIGYMTAKALLEKHRHAHTNLTLMLQSYSIMDEKAIEQWFGSRRWIKVAGLFRAYFI